MRFPQAQLSVKNLRVHYFQFGFFRVPFCLFLFRVAWTIHIQTTLPSLPENRHLWRAQHTSESLLHYEFGFYTTFFTHFEVFLFVADDIAFPPTRGERPRETTLDISNATYNRLFTGYLSVYYLLIRLTPARWRPKNGNQLPLCSALRARSYCYYHCSCHCYHHLCKKFSSSLGPSYQYSFRVSWKGRERLSQGEIVTACSRSFIVLFSFVFFLL